MEAAFPPLLAMVVIDGAFGYRGQEEHGMFALITPVRAVLLVAVILLLGFAAPAPAQSTWYVDDDAPNDPGPGDPNVSDPDEDGSPEHPFDAIQEGIDAAVDGGETADGIYEGVYHGG